MPRLSGTTRVKQSSKASIRAKTRIEKLTQNAANIIYSTYNKVQSWPLECSRFLAEVEKTEKMAAYQLGFLDNLGSLVPASTNWRKIDFSVGLKNASNDAPHVFRNEKYAFRPPNSTPTRRINTRVNRIPTELASICKFDDFNAFLY